MATVPNPRTWGSTEAVTSAKLNTDIRDSWNFFLNTKPFCHVQQSFSNRTLAANVYTSIIWDNEIADTDGGWSAGTPTRYTAQTAGLYAFRAHLEYSNTDPQPIWSHGYFQSSAGLGYGDNVLVHHADDYTLTQDLSAFIPMTVGQWVDVRVAPQFEASSSLASYAHMTVEWLSI